MSGEPQASPHAAAGEQYFTSRPGSASRPGTVHVLLPGLHLELRTDAGVFSPRRLDPGTRLLLDVAPPPPPAGDLLDLGCGYGPLALTLAARAPGARIWAVDVNQRALDLVHRRERRTLLGLTNVNAVTPEVFPPLEVAFMTIWSNPPIRVGKNELHRMLLHWLSRDASSWRRTPGSSCSATSARTPCTGGWMSRAGPPSGSRPGPAYRVLAVTGPGAASPDPASPDPVSPDPASRAPR